MSSRTYGSMYGWDYERNYSTMRFYAWGDDEMEVAPYDWAVDYLEMTSGDDGDPDRRSRISASGMRQLAQNIIRDHEAEAAERAS